MTVTLNIDINQVKGFLANDEAQALHETALEHAGKAPALEIGSYCGKSTIYLGKACQAAGGILYALDHHRGSEEHQRGEQYHDPDLFDAELKVMDSFREFRKNIHAAGLDNTVVPIVASSELASRAWATPLSMVFIDGGHSLQAAMTDYRCWATHVIPGGVLAIHDIFPNPQDGGQAPLTIYNLALASGLFEPLPMVNTLGMLRRLQ